MKEHQADVPRIALALVAVALTATTLGAFVVMPAVYYAGYDPVLTLAVTVPGASPAAVEVAIDPARIDVIGVRVPDVAWAMPDAAKPCKPEV